MCNFQKDVDLFKAKKVSREKVCGDLQVYFFIFYLK